MILGISNDENISNYYWFISTKHILNGILFLAFVMTTLSNDKKYKASQWAHDIRNVYVTFYKCPRDIPMSNIQTFQKRSQNVFRALDIAIFLERL